MEGGGACCHGEGGQSAVPLVEGGACVPPWEDQRDLGGGACRPAVDHGRPVGASPFQDQDASGQETERQRDRETVARGNTAHTYLLSMWDMAVQFT